MRFPGCRLADALGGHPVAPSTSKVSWYLVLIAVRCSIARVSDGQTGNEKRTTFSSSARFAMPGTISRASIRVLRCIRNGSDITCPVPSAQCLSVIATRFVALALMSYTVSRDCLRLLRGAGLCTYALMHSHAHDLSICSMSVCASLAQTDADA